MYAHPDPKVCLCERPRAFQGIDASRTSSTRKRCGKRVRRHNDALIALTARGHGATVVTANRADFRLLSRAVGVSVLFV
jgi:predicted nucleic acid-binding protein